jgi:two-component system sensor histidine kinase PilS (NtrC family)
MTWQGTNGPDTPPYSRRAWQTEAVQDSPDKSRRMAFKIMLGRLILLGLIPVGLTTLLGDDHISFFAFIALAFVVNVPFTLWLRHEETARESVPHQFILDTLIITGLIHYTGGINSQLCLLYPLAILSAGLVLSGPAAVKIAVLSIVLYVTLVLLEMQGILVYRGALPSPYDSPTWLAQTLMLRILLFIFFAGAGSYLADRCAYQNSQIRQLRQVAEFIFDNVRIALLAVEKDGRIVFANAAALDLLGLTAQTRKLATFNEFFSAEKPDLNDPELGGKVWAMHRVDGTCFHGSLEVSLGQFPIIEEDTGGGISSAERYVIALRDMTEILKLQQRAHDSAKLRTALGIATEVGHWVRNPLTAIKMAVDLERSMLENRNQKRLTDADLALLGTMCRVIAEETNRLEDKVDYLLKCADEDHSKLLDLMSEAETWTSRVRPMTGEKP